ncbi:Protein of unknown function [Gryllus bimaculatus]|nr:Protein of unknown function [Gryllus bimaculatus]
MRGVRCLCRDGGAGRSHQHTIRATGCEAVVAMDSHAIMPSLPEQPSGGCATDTGRRGGGNMMNSLCEEWELHREGESAPETEEVAPRVSSGAGQLGARHWRHL